MGLEFIQDSLSLLDGELFLSHKKKVDEMEEKWQDYPFRNYSLKLKTKKSFVFRKAFAECPCGRQANLACSVEKCRRCCLKESAECKTHKVKRN